jgi:hypothetical protein
MIPCLFSFPELLVTGCIPGRPASASTHCENLVSTQLMQGLHRAEKLAKRVLTADTLLCKNTTVSLGKAEKAELKKRNSKNCRKGNE